MKYYLGIDLGGTNIAVGLVDENYKIVKKGSVPTDASRHPDEIVADMGKLCLKVVSEYGIGIEDVEACGIASPGTANGDTGIVEYANNISMLNYPIVERLRKHIGLEKIHLDNDANAAALGEALAGSAKGASSALMITLGTGVGGGIIIDGKIYSGFNHAGAELGHTVIEKDGRQCSCGRKGCFEAYSSATGLINMTREKMELDPSSAMWDVCGRDITKVTGRTAFNAVKQYKDRSASEVCDMYISYLATGIANMMNIFQPEVISIGGGVSNEGDGLFVPLCKQVYAENYAKNSKKQTKIEKATLGNDAGIIGAAALGMTRT